MPSPVTVLNVDDDDPGRQARSSVLRQAGYHVVEACQADALETAAREPVDLILVAQRSPAALDLLRDFGTHPSTASTPLLKLDPFAPVERTVQQIRWLSRPSAGTAGQPQPYGDLAALNRRRVVAEAAGEECLRDMVSDYLGLLDTCSAVYERNGDYALRTVHSAWCRFLDRRSRELCATPDNAAAMASGRWLCHEECWRASRLSIETGAPVDTECAGGLRRYAQPIRAGSEIVGSINFGYGDPPDDDAKLKEIAHRYQVSIEELRGHAERYQSRPSEIVEVAKRRLDTSARLLGTLVIHQQAEDRLRRLQAVTAMLARAVSTEEVSETIVERVMRAAGAAGSVLVLLTPQGDALTEAGSSGYFGSLESARRRFTMDSLQPVVEAVKSGELVVEEGHGTARWPDLPPGPDGAVAAVPLILRSRVVGALGLRFREPRRFGAEEREFLVIVGRTCAQALERARSHDAERWLLDSVSRENQRLEEIFSNLPGLFATYSGPEHRLEFANPVHIQMWGGRNPLGKPVREALPELGEEMFALFDRVYGTGDPERAAEVTATVDGRAKVFDISVLPRRDAEGKVRGVLAHTNDVTERVHARKQLEAQRAFTEAVLDQLPVGVALADSSGTILFINAEARRLLGGADAAALFREGGRSRELLQRRADGSAVHLMLRAATVRGEGGHVLAQVLAFNDIGGQRRAQQTLRQQAQAINLSHDAIITADANGVITGWNAGAEQMYGYAAAEALGKVTHDLLRTRAAVPNPEVDALVRREGRWHGELVHTGWDGREILVDSRHVLVRDEEGNPAGHLEINRDVTQRRRSEQALRESEEWLRFTQRAAGVGILDWDVAAGRQKCSEEFYRIHGVRERFSAGEVDWESLTHPEDRELVRSRIRDAMAGGGACELEYRIVWPDQSVHWISFKGTVFFDAAGRPLRMIAAVLDVSERRRAEEAQRSAQKLESIGVLAGGVAHDFNNLLTSIMGNTSLVLDQVEGDAREHLEAVMLGAQRAADLTRQLLAYAGKGRFVIRDLDISALVRQMNELMRLSIPKNIELRSITHPGLPAVRADAGQIQQVIMNLVINAAESIGEGEGTVTVSTGAQEMQAPFEDGVLGAAPAGRYVFVEVADTGSGMDDATRAKIFDPFFTTKFIGRGLGLAAVSGILRAHKGAISIDTAPGAGSRFRVLFPAAGEAQPQPAPPAARAPAARAGTVLVVDDEDYVRNFLGNALIRAGFRIVTAGNGREAIELLEHNSAIQLMVLDLIMPGMGGAEVLAQMARRWPGLPVLVTSGYDQTEAERICAAHQIEAFIQKPYTAADVVAKVQEVLDRGSGTQQ